MCKTIGMPKSRHVWLLIYVKMPSQTLGSWTVLTTYCYISDWVNSLISFGWNKVSLSIMSYKTFIHLFYSLLHLSHSLSPDIWRTCMDPDSIHKASCCLCKPPGLGDVCVCLLLRLYHNLASHLPLWVQQARSVAWLGEDLTMCSWSIINFSGTSITIFFEHR